MKNPPILIAILGFFAALAGFSFLFFGLRVLGFDWFGALGDLPAFEHVGLWGWLAIATGIVWLLAAVGLWALQPWARWFAMFMAGFALFEAVLAFFQFPGTGVGFAMAIMPALILWYLSSSEVKAAFGEGEQPEPAVAAPGGRSRRRWSPRRLRRSPRRVAVATDGARPAAVSRRRSLPHQTRIADVEGIGPAYAEKLAAAGIATTDDLLAAGAKPLRPREDRGGHRDQQQAHPRVGRQGRSHARPGCRPAVQRPARGRRRRITRRARPAERRAPRDHGPGGRRRTAGHRPSGPERGRDRGLDRAGGQLDMLVEH